MPSEIYLPNLLLSIPRNPVTAVGIPLVLGVFSGWSSSDVLKGPWYSSLRHPPGRPGRLLPPLLWTVMYSCVGYASHLAVKQLDKEVNAENRSRLSRGLLLYYAHLGLNFAYVPIFLGARQLGASLVDSTVMTGLVYYMTKLFNEPTESKTSYLLVPYCVWLTYATYMNAGVWWLNREFYEPRLSQTFVRWSHSSHILSSDALLSAALARLPHAAHIIDNPAQKSIPRESIPVINPATGEVISNVASASSEDVRITIEDAHRVFQSGVWSKAPALQRSKVLSRFARLLEERMPALARMESAQTGRTIREMNAQLGRLPEWLDYFAALLRTNQSFVAPTQGKLLNYVERVPLGVVAQITPFNHPLLIAVKKIAPALAAGNSIIVKPSELAPVTVLDLAEMAEEAGVPRGVLNVLPGYGATTGKQIVSNTLIRKVDITAGTNTGRELGSVVGSNLAAYTAELGGKAPIVIFDDADIVSAVNGTAFAAFVASGQTCVSGARIIVQDGIYDEFMLHFLAKVESIRKHMGNPLHPKSSMGTVISSKHLQRIDKMVQSRTSGAIVAGGHQMTSLSELDGFDLSRGSFYAPTVITDISIDDTLWNEEVFGPVVVVKRFVGEDEGIMLANSCKYGLGSAIWTQNLSRAHRIAARMEAGICWINTHHKNDPSSPWGGMKESGIGRENGLEAFHAYSQSKSTIVNIATAEETRKGEDWFAEGEVVKRYG